MRFSYRRELAASARAAIEATFSPMRLLEELVRWGLRQTPAHPVLDVVVQDEYTHDVVVRWSEELVLVFDST